MQGVSTEQKERVLKVLEIALQVGSPLQIGRLWGIGEQIARGHEEKERSNAKKRSDDLRISVVGDRNDAGRVSNV